MTEWKSVCHTFFDAILELFSDNNAVITETAYKLTYTFFAEKSWALDFKEIWIKFNLIVVAQLGYSIAN